MSEVIKEIDASIVETGEKIVFELTEEDVEADRFTVGESVDDGLIRIRFYNEDGLLSSYIVDSAGAYELAQRILRGYDKLEGL